MQRRDSSQRRHANHTMHVTYPHKKSEFSLELRSSLSARTNTPNNNQPDACVNRPHTLAHNTYFHMWG